MKSEIVEKANKLLEQNLWCEIDDEQLKEGLKELGLDDYEIQVSIMDGRADYFEQPCDDDFNPYYGCYNSDFKN